MGFSKRWFKHYDETKEDTKKGCSRFVTSCISLDMFSKDIDDLSVKFINDGGEMKITFIISIPYVIKFVATAELKKQYYKKHFRHLARNDYTLSSGFVINKRHVSANWRHLRHHYEPERNRGWEYYSAYEQILKGEKEIFEIVSKKSPVVLSKTLVVPYQEGWETTELGKGVEVITEVTFAVKEKIFLTHFKRWMPKIEKTFEVTAVGGPLVDVGLGQKKEAFSYIMGGDYLVPIGKVKTSEEAANYYVEELKRRIA